MPVFVFDGGTIPPKPAPLSPDLVADLRSLVLRWRSEGRHDDAVDLEKMLSFELRVRR